jgi:hypothetical protein
MFVFGNNAMMQPANRFKAAKPVCTVTVATVPAVWYIMATARHTVEGAP